MKILGIGNAIVDVICKVNDDFISKNNLTKGLMKLIFDETEFEKLLMIDMTNGKIKAPIPKAGDLDAMKLTIII